MPDGSTLITLPIPPEALKRLKTAEKRQRALTKERGLVAVPVSVEGLILLQMRDGKVLCGCGCGEPLDFISKWDEKSPPPGYVVIAHRLARGSRGDHSPRNVSLDRHACNKRDAAPDTSGAASVKRFTPDFTKRDREDEQQPLPMQTPTRRDPGKWQSKPPGYVSPLSKKYRQQVKARVEGK